jgi:NIMA (never in mitosis gene a)-related kinase
MKGLKPQKGLKIPGLGSRSSTYEPIKVLGRGAFGTAYLVRTKNVPLVLKRVDMMHMDTASREEALGECKVLTLLRESRHIIQLHEHFTDKGNLFLLMDFADAGDLAQAIDRQKKAGEPFAESAVLRWTAMVVLALRHAHERKVLHRDLKPQNIFLTSDGEVRLGDFGISRVLTSTLAVANTCVGTPLYLAPELINGEPYGGSCDIWSLGVVLHEMCALKPPFIANVAPALYLKIVNDDPVPIPEVYSAPLRELTAKLLQKRPEARPTVSARQAQ